MTSLCDHLSRTRSGPLFEVYCYVNQIPVYNTTARRIRPLSLNVDQAKRSNLHTFGTVLFVGHKEKRGDRRHNCSVWTRKITIILQSKLPLV